MSTERKTIGGEYSKIGTAHIERRPFASPEKTERIITPKGFVEYGEKLKDLMKEEGDRAKIGAGIVLEHITGTSPENISFMKESGVDQKLEETAGKIDELVGTNQRHIDTLIENVS